MELKPLIRQVLDDNSSNHRYSDDLIDELISEALRYLSLKLGGITKTVKLQSTKEGKIFLKDNLGVVSINNVCDIKLKHISEVCMTEDKSEGTLNSLKYLIYGEDDRNTLTLYPKIESVAILDDIQSVIASTTILQQAVAPTIDPEYLVITYKTVPTVDDYPDSWKKLIYYYVTGNLFRFDKSENNIAFGESQLKHLRYDIELVQASNNRM